MRMLPAGIWIFLKFFKMYLSVRCHGMRRHRVAAVVVIHRTDADVAVVGRRGGSGGGGGSVAPGGGCGVAGVAVATGR